MRATSLPTTHVKCFSAKPFSLLFTALLWFGLASNLSAQTPNYQANITATSNWMASGSVNLSDGAVVSGANSARINPYFANLGTIGWTKDANHYGQVKNWMEWYWGHVSWPDQWGHYGSIDDFDVTYNGSSYSESATPDSPSSHHPDSTDAYAGTFLSLAYAYYQTGDANAQAYIQSIVEPAPPNSDRLDYVGEIIIATKQSQGNNLTWARPDWNIEYLMDACEAYRGLRDLASLYTSLGLTSKASFYNTHADQMLNGIQTYLWNASANDYFRDTTDSGVSDSVNWTVWYPDAVSQLFPIAFGILSPSDPRAQALYSAFNQQWGSQWPTLQIPDQYPWAVVGYVAALMGDTQRANTYINTIQSVFISNNFNGDANHFWSVNEAGWFIRMNAVLNNGNPGSEPSQPDAALQYQNVDNLSGWQGCGNCGGGDSTGSTFTQGASVGGRTDAIDFFVTGAPWAGNYEFYTQAGPASIVQNAIYEFDVYVPSQYAGLVNAIELELQQSDSSGNVYNMAWQLRYISGGMMDLRMFDYYCNHTPNCVPPADSSGQHDTWEQSGIQVPQLTANTWYHVRAHYSISGNIITHDWIEIEPVGSQFARYTPTENNTHQSFNQQGYGQAFNAALQLDLNGSGNPYHVYFDALDYGYNQSNF